MAHIHIPSEVPVRYLPRSKNASMMAGVLFLVGLVSFVIRLGQDPDQAWISYVSNWLFFTSIAIGGVLFGIATWIVKSKWNWSMRRVSQSFVAFLPFSFLLALPMLFMLRENYFPWIDMMGVDPVVSQKEAYLNIPFLVTRNLVGMLALFGMATYFVYLAIRPDMGLTEGADEDDPGRASWRARLTQGWMGQEQEEVSSYKRMTRMAPAFVLIYAIV
ncbi:MAG: hypothetical protein HOE14_04900, partial [Gemmatimonadales bacterium]|nr:hypothetical protein [Gemmatimonadales bacterium]